MSDEAKKNAISLARRNLLDRCGDGIAQALDGADREIAAHALRMLWACLGVLANCEVVRNTEAQDMILQLDPFLCDAVFEIEAQGTIPPVQSINNGLSEAASCLLGLAIRQKPEKVARIEIGNGPMPVKVRRVSR